ncbi:MAG: hypothetical protein SAL07_12965 [Oscillatoria sp. PMC 1051.18]|nr:hypothetical protein [Oscillatoria sp. PMC 1050.18]MEC5030802.1 hypothetical protein [Oscillatoria sp. PMC 1051.18]
MNQQRQDLYLNLIEELLRCPNGQEPEVLDNHQDLLDAELIKMMMQVATMLAHENNQDAAKFLIHVARQLAKNLGLYPQLENSAPANS